MTLCGILFSSSTKIKTMSNITKKSISRHLLSAQALFAAAVVLAVGIAMPFAHADQYDEQINALSSQNASAQSALNGLTSVATTYQAAIDQLQAQINGVEAQINASQIKQAELQTQITDAENKIAQQRAFLREDIKTMYVDGQLSTIEQLATSKNLSEYVDKEEYRTSVQNKINVLIKQIASLQVQLRKQKAELDQLIAAEQSQRNQLAAAQAQQQTLLSYNEAQQQAYTSSISSNNSKIAELRRQQLAANSRFIGGQAGTGPACGGGYPAKWCEIPQDAVIDSWGMYNRECVSYTAFRVAASGRHMPYWGGIGNANQWDDNARAAGIPVDTSPRPGDVAISNSGYYGHAMYVESVNADGTINISQYNAALNGRYSERYNMSPAGLYFIHF